MSTRPPRAAPHQGAARRRLRRPHLAVFLLPAVLIVVGLLVYPVVLSVVSSFQGRTGDFTGVDNYVRFLQDPQSADLILHTFVRGVFGVIPSYLLGLGAALLINRLVKSATALTIVAVLPFVISAPVALHLWSSLLDTRLGVLAAFGVHIQNPLTDTSLVWPILLGINAWGSFQFYLLLLLPARRRIPEELYEAASIDGASAWARFRAVTLPAMAGPSLTACMIHFIASFQEFNLVYILTGGGPVNATATLPTAAFQQAFSYNNPSYATTLTTVSMVLMIATLGVAALVVIGFRRLRTVRERRWADIVLRATGPVTAPLRRRTTSRRGRPGLARGARRVWLAIGGVVLGAFALLPILFQVSLSLDGTPAGAQTVSLFPRQFSFENYVHVLGNPDLWSNDNIALPPLALNLVNSLIVTAACTMVVTAIGMFAGFALARMRMRTTPLLVSFFVLLQLVPVIVIVFPLYDVLSKVGLLGTQAGLVVATSALFLPMSVLFFQVYFASQGVESEEAAAIDGAGPFRTFVAIVMPMSKSVIGSVATYVLINTWNEFLLATTLISDSQSRTLPPALFQYMSSPSFQSTSSPGEQAVYLLIPVAVAAVILVATQRLLLSAYHSGGVKG